MRLSASLLAAAGEGRRSCAADCELGRMGRGPARPPAASAPAGPESGARQQDSRVGAFAAPGRGAGGRGGAVRFGAARRGAMRRVAAARTLAKT